MNTSEMTEYQEFLAFRAMKAAALKGAVVAAPPVRKIDWEAAVRHVLNFSFNVGRKVPCATNAEWWMWRNIYMADPSAFRLIGELHNDPVTAETYISVRYDWPDTDVFATFHIYGVTSGHRFMASRITWSQSGLVKTGRPLWAFSGAPHAFGDSRSTSGSE
jgi:hypothetical protein